MSGVVGPAFHLMTPAVWRGRAAKASRIGCRVPLSDRVAVRKGGAVSAGKQGCHCVDERQPLRQLHILGPGDADWSSEQHGGRGHDDRLAELVNDVADDGLGSSSGTLIGIGPSSW